MSEPLDSRLDLVESRFQPRQDGKCAVSAGGMVATAFPDATRAGVLMLARGGNAVDAAVAAAFALAVCEPQASGLGGQTMAVVHIGGKTVALDGSGRAPSLAHADRFERNSQPLGYKAATVPSTPAVLGYLHLRYGRLPWGQVLEPAIALARNGYRITPMQSSLQARELAEFLDVPSRSGARYFLLEGRRPHRPGAILVQSELAALLETLAEHGPRGLYLGPAARMIDEDMRANGGLIRADDLALIPWPIERKALMRSYRGIQIATLPPPASGRTLLLVLLMLSHVSSELLASGSPESVHFMVETFRKAFLQHRQRPVDPDFYPQAPDDAIIDTGFALNLVRSIREVIDPELRPVEAPTEGGETTHISVLDNEGNAVGISQSIEAIYGSKAAAAGLGFMYNNYIRTYERKDPSNPYFLRPNAVPWSSVAPAIVFHGETPWLVFGSPASDRIYSTMTQFLVHVVDGGLSMPQAVERPRLHCSMGATVSLEADRFDPAVISHLERLGYTIDRHAYGSFYFGAITAAMRCRDGRTYHGVAEVRRDGSAAGPA
jgi:gamma-glutamyltranspeptidase/glutathione hydrolase